MGKHWIGMAGLSGCMPNYCGVYDTKCDAARSLATMHEEARGTFKRLMRDGYAALDLARDGNEYAEMIDCSCTTPEVHEEA